VNDDDVPVEFLREELLRDLMDERAHREQELAQLNAAAGLDMGGGKVLSVSSLLLRLRLSASLSLSLSHAGEPIARARLAVGSKVAVRALSDVSISAYVTQMEVEDLVTPHASKTHILSFAETGAERYRAVTDSRAR